MIETFLKILRDTERALWAQFKNYHLFSIIKDMLYFFSQILVLIKRLNNAFAYKNEYCLKLYYIYPP